MSRFLPAVSLLLAVVAIDDCALAQSVPHVDPDQLHGGVQDLYLAVFVNGEDLQLVAAARRTTTGQISMPADQLRGVGILPQVEDSDGYVPLDALKGVTYRFDEASQSIYFEAENEARAARKIGKHQETAEEDASPVLESATGAVVNYSLFANFTSDEILSVPSYQGISGSFDTRIFSPYGVLQSNFIATTSPAETYRSTRLDTSWSYSSPGQMVTYRVGDVITGGLTWTRPVRLGGVQIQRNFSLRPDLVTMPQPDLSGTAEVPSSVEVYANRIKRFSADVGSGPFQITDVPVSSGPGTVQIVVRDRFGRETIEEVAFYTSSRMLAPGLLDFSLDGGFARRDFGLRTDNYDDRFMASGSLRYGLTPRVTLEAHLEGGEKLLSGGAAALFNIGSLGIATANFAASRSGALTGFRVGGSIEAALGGWRLFASSQRTIGDYNDIASITARHTGSDSSKSARVPRAVDQVSLSAPPFADGSAVSLNFANIEDPDGIRSNMLGASYSRTFKNNTTLHASVDADLTRSGRYGVFVGISRTWGQDTVSVARETTDAGSRTMVDYSRPLGLEPWSVGWRLRLAEGNASEKSAKTEVRTPVARLEGTVRQTQAGVSTSMLMSGAVAMAGGGVFVSERVPDAFAVVDVGAPDVSVSYQNRLVGKTGRNGKLIVPKLVSVRENAIEIDPTDLPVDVDVPMTRQTATPAEKSGVVLKFGISPDLGTALVTFTQADGSFVPVGATGQLAEGDEDFVVGYDGQAYIRGLQAVNRVEISLPETGETCSSSFAFKPVPGQQVTIDGVVCQ